MGPQYPMKLIRHRTRPRAVVQHECLGLPPCPPPKSQVLATRPPTPAPSPSVCSPASRHRLGTPQRPPTMNVISILTWLRGLQALVMPGRHDVAIGSGGERAIRSPSQPAMPHQIRSSATPLDATKLVMTARKSAMVSQQRSANPRSGTQQVATTPQARALPTHQVTVRILGNAKASQGARVHAPEHIKAERPGKFTKQCHPTRYHEARRNSGNDVSTMERCGASRWNQTRITHQAQNDPLRIRKPR